MTWTLHHGDCLDPATGLAILADKSVDHVISDPPYEVEAHTLARRQRSGGGVGVLSIPFESITDHVRSESAREIVRVSSGWALAFCQVEAVSAWRDSFVAAGAKWIRAMVWVKPDGAPQFTGDRPAQGYECIAVAWCGTGRSRWNAGGKRGVYTHMVGAMGGDRNPHPTTKPLSLMRELVEDFTSPGDLILDPFAGSGTTGLAARILGRRFIGWERDANYHAIATRRLSGDEAKPRLEQPSLFDAQADRQRQAQYEAHREMDERQAETLREIREAEIAAAYRSAP